MTHPAGPQGHSSFSASPRLCVNQFFLTQRRRGAEGKEDAASRGGQSGPAR
jgi:hypothetical protein